jgi:peptidoglycan/xylan/chitin deacetylase (PgdA/CDA1 family)
MNVKKSLYYFVSQFYYLQVKNGTYIYMTFDDGPNEGTPYVLDALKEMGVRATFFINSDNLIEGDQANITEFSKLSNRKEIYQESVNVGEP